MELFDICDEQGNPTGDTVAGRPTKIHRHPILLCARLYHLHSLHVVSLFFLLLSSYFHPFRYDTDPDKGQAITLSNESRTQVAVNNEGKTNEATKHVKEPLKQGQTAPADARQQEQQQQGRRQSRSANPKL